MADSDEPEREKAAIEKEVRQFLAENFIIDAEAGSLSGSASLTQAGVLDSMGVLELIMFIEQHFGIAVPDEDTLPENLDSVERIVRYVGERRASKTLAHG